MKKFTTIFFLFVATSLCAQQIKPGTYHGVGLNTGVNLRVNADYTFDLILVSGKFENQGDRLFFNREKLKEIAPPLQLVKKEAIEGNDLELRIDIIKNFYYLGDIFIGFQYENEDPEYQSLSEFFDQIIYTGDHSENPIISKRIGQPKKIFLFKENYESLVPLAEFSIPDFNHAYQLEPQIESFENVYLEAYIKDNGQLTLSDGTIDIMEFQSEIPSINKEQIIQASNQLMLREDLKLADIDIYVAYTDTIKNQEDYTYEIETFDNLKQALKRTEESDGKFLVVFYDEDEKSKEKFEEIIKNYAQNVSYYMYDDYNGIYDPFSFYIPERKEISKWQEGDGALLLIFDRFQNLVFKKHTKIAALESQFSYNSKLSEKLKKSSIYAELDRRLAQKSANSIVDFLEPLNDYFSYGYIEQFESESDSNSEDNFWYMGEEIKLWNSREDFYSFKTSQNKLNEVWKNDFIKNSIKGVNYKLGKISISELKGEGFNQVLFGKSYEDNQVFSMMLNYYLDNYDSLEKLELELNSGEIYNYIIQQNKPYNLISNVLNQVKSEKEINILIDKLIAHYQNEEKCLCDRINFLEQFQVDMPDEQKFITMVDNLFTDVSKVNPSIILALNYFYDRDAEIDGWVYYKSTFAGLLNNTAWKIVKEDYQFNWLPKAIVWSEKSLELMPNFSYYLDTLARLYYKNGDTEKATETMKLAIEMGPKINDEFIDNYKLVLQKMIAGEPIDEFYPN